MTTSTKMKFLNQVFRETEDGDLVCVLCGHEIAGEKTWLIDHVRDHVDEWLAELKDV